MEVAVPAGALLGECPVWSTAEQALYWVDIDGRTLHRFDPSTGSDERLTIDHRPGSIGLTADPSRLLVAADHQMAFVDWPSGSFESWVQLEEPGTPNRLNDGRTDPAGRFWVGSMFERPGERQATGALYRLDPDGTVKTERRQVRVSNTLAFSPDGHTMYWSDTPTGIVWSHPYDPDTGEVGPPEVFVDFADLPGGPDGACVDTGGGVWIACVHGGALLRVTPTGEIDRRVETPVRSPTMPAFGGSDLRTMYVTSIGPAVSVSAPRHGPMDGALLAWEPGVQGLPEPVFGTAKGATP